MISRLKNVSVEIGILILLIIFILAGVSTIPFHPDESSWLYMSRDFELFFSNPSSLMWDASRAFEVDQYKRMIDAPLAKYVIGTSRIIVGVPTIKSDWNWELSWSANKHAGALPTRYQLYVGRLTNTLLFIACTVLIYIAGKNLESRLAGISAAIFFGTNSLLLLHNRHVMAEGVLTFCIVLSIIAVFYGNDYPWFIGLAVALAVNSKQSVIPLVVVGLASVLWIPNQKFNIKRQGKNFAIYSIVLIGLSYILNPLWWSHPARVPIEAWIERVKFRDTQVATLRLIAPNQVLDTTFKRIVSFIANLYILPPAFYDAANYVNETEISQVKYISIPGHNILRGNIGGGIILLLSLFGTTIGVINTIGTTDPVKRRKLALLLFATSIQAIAILVAIPIPYQRYVIPMIPFIAIWIGYGSSLLLIGIRNSIKSLKFP